MLENPKVTKDEIVTWIQKYFQSNGPECCAVVGISGGKDSTIVAALCVEALGKDKVVGVLMPQGFQSDFDDSIRVVDHLGIQHYVVNIGESVELLKSSIYSFGDGLALSNQASINLPARIRMTTLYAVAQSLPTGGRVANTCNRSEDYIGYSTKYGDSAGDFSPLGNLVVEEVLQIGHVLDLPEDLIRKAPADGLSGKTDEDNFGFTYETLDHYILTRECDDEVVKQKIDLLHYRNIHKILPMPAFPMQ